MLLVRINLYSSGVISCKFVVFSANISMFADGLMLFMCSVSFFWQSFLTGLKLTHRMMSYRSFTNDDNSSCYRGVKLDLNPKFILFPECSFLSKKCAFHLNLAIKVSTFSITLFRSRCFGGIVKSFLLPCSLLYLVNS